MGIEFARPLAWLLLPVCAALVFVIDRVCPKRRLGKKRAIARAARLVLVFLMVAALAGPALLLPGNRAATWALADLSASALKQRSAMEGALAAGLQNAGKGLMTGVLSFGQSTMVDAPLSEGRTDIPLDTAPDASATDIGRALAMAMALLPEDAAGRIALLSDGQDNVGGVAAQLSALKARGIAVDVLPFESGAVRDAQITSVSPPAQVYQGEKFDVPVRIDSLYETKGTLVLYANRQPVSTREVTLRKGENTFVFKDTAAESGVITYEVQLIANGDDNPRNDRLGAYMDVRGIPRVLLVGGNTSELQAMLHASGMQPETLLPSQLPGTAEALRQYHAVALVNVNADDLSDDAVAALDDYVRKLGRGLLAFGGDDSYALGGWRGSGLEDMLPVTMDVDNRLDMPSLSLVLIIDKSGSMTEGRYGVTRLDMAKEAAMRSCEVLTTRDNVGVIAFDDTAKWVVPLQQVEDVPAIQDLIGTIRPSGGTLYYSSLAQAFAALLESKSQLKHVIFLTDGEPGDGGFENVVLQMAQNGMTMTTVAVGGGANTSLLRRLAEYGNGRAYTAGEFDDIPKVFTKETYLATQAYVQNRTFYPIIWSPGPLTNYDGFPSLDGYIATTAKPLATVALATDREEPLLAWWQYGAGRALAWTSDVSGAWTGGMLRWEQAAEFFAGMVAHVLPAEEGEGELTLSRQGDTVSLRYETADEETGLSTEATVLSPDGTEETVLLSATAPGVYEGTMNAAQEGAYAVRIEQRQGGSLLRTLETGVTVGYSAEYDLRAADGIEMLEKIARETGGRVLTEAAELFTARGAQTRAKRDITTVLLVIALVLFVLDAAQRRLSWERWIPKRKPADGKEKVDGKVQRPQAAAAAPRAAEKAQPAPQPPASQTGEKLLAGRKKKLL